MTKAVRELFDFDIEEISLVDKAANMRQFLVLKNSEPNQLDMVNALIECERKDIEHFVKGVQCMGEDTTDVAKFFPPMMGMNPMFAPFMQGQPDMSSMIMLRQIGDTLQKVLGLLAKPEEQEQIMTEPASDAEIFDSYVPEPEMIEKEAKMTTQSVDTVDIEKAVADKVAELEKQLRSEYEVKISSLTKAIEDQRLAEFVTKAEAYSVLGADAAEFGAVLKSLHDWDTELAAKVESVLKNAVDVTNKVALTKEDGVTGEATSEAAPQDTKDFRSQVVEKAADFQKADSTLTRETALSKAVEFLTSAKK